MTSNFQKILISIDYCFFVFSQNMCIRQEAGFCCITYNLCSDTSSWTIDNTAKSVVGTECSNDFVEIPGELGFF